jgi:hypothetical protein
VADVGYLLDEHVAHAIAQALRRRSIVARTAADAGLLGAPDTSYLSYSQLHGLVVVTHDSDFLRLHEAGELHCGIAFCPQGARSIGEIVSGLVLIAQVLTPEEMMGRVEFL